MRAEANINMKKVIKKPFEVAEEIAREAKKQIKAQAPAPEETLGIGPTVGKKRIQKIQEEEEKKLREARMEKAKMLPEWRQRYQRIQEEMLKAAKEREEKEEEKKREGKKKEEEKPMPSGEEAMAATGATQKRPTGLWGIGQKFKKLFKWFTAERKGRAPR